jgi:hypothetical protein
MNDARASEVLKGSQQLSAQQMQALTKSYADALVAIKRDVELRKWSVDQACSLAGSQLEAEVPVMMHPITLAREIHAFLTEGANEKAAGE